jgi:hypothetical protein
VISIDITSANGLSSQTYEIQAYVYSIATKSQTVAFLKNKTELSKSAKSALKSLGITIGINALDDLNLKIYGAATKYKAFKKAIVGALTSAGMPTPESVQYIVKPKMAKNSFKVTATYVN